MTAACHSRARPNRQDGLAWNAPGRAGPETLVLTRADFPPGGAAGGRLDGFDER
jgi:hypothetical protein